MSSLFQVLKYNPEINEGYLRHLILNTYRMYRKKFFSKYGELVICHDSTNYWRKDFFPQYKANRKKALEKSGLNWNELFSIMDKIRDEIKETFPYKNIKVSRLEADDVIACLCREFHDKEKILILSSDKDFQQLQRYENVDQYSPLKKEFLVCDDPEHHLLYHIIKGDASDGVPNLLSDDDTFVVEDKRQKPCGKKAVDKVLKEIDQWKETENWKRNQTIIDLHSLPEKYRQEVNEVYNLSLIHI